MKARRARQPAYPLRLVGSTTNQPKTSSSTAVEPQQRRGHIASFPSQASFFDRHDAELTAQKGNPNLVSHGRTAVKNFLAPFANLVFLPTLISAFNRPAQVASTRQERKTGEPVAGLIPGAFHKVKKLLSLPFDWAQGIKHTFQALRGDRTLMPPESIARNKEWDDATEAVIKDAKEGLLGL